MKRYIAFDGNGNSGIQTKEKATQWAIDRMAKNTAVSTIHIAEIFEVVERAIPPVTVKSFIAVAEDTQLSKAA